MIRYLPPGMNSIKFRLYHIVYMIQFMFGLYYTVYKTSAYSILGLKPPLPSPEKDGVQVTAPNLAIEPNPDIPVVPEQQQPEAQEQHQQQSVIEEEPHNLVVEVNPPVMITVAPTHALDPRFHDDLGMVRFIFV